MRVITTTLLALGALAASASAHRPFVCSGTLAKPGVLSGTHKHGVLVKGACDVNAGKAKVIGTLRVRRGATLVAAFALNDRSHHGNSSLTVNGDLVVGRGATLVLGCNASEFACIDDNPNKPTLNSAATVSGNLTATAPLGILVHNAKIGGNVTEKDGGGGLSCTPPASGPFSLLHAPVYSAYDDSSVGGDLKVESLTSCYLGVARVHVKGSLLITRNKLGDPDAIEILSNHVGDDLVCRRDTTVWDSHEASFGQPGIYPRLAAPNKIHGKRVGQCKLASPATAGGKPGPGKF